jgi:HK97 family phage major capsid protein
MLKELLQEQGVESNIVKSMNIGQVFASGNERIQSLDQIVKAMDTLTEGEGKEWIPTNMRPQMLERLRLSLRVPGLFETFTIGNDQEMLPVEGGDAQAYLVPENTADTGQEGITPSTPGTAQVNFKARTIGAMTRVSKKANRDSIIPLIPYIQFKLLRALAVGRENAIINGDISSTHQDSGVTGAKDVRKAWPGLRKLAIANGWTIDAADFSADTIFEGLAMMGEYGVENPEDIALIFSPTAYAKFRMFPEIRTKDKVGDDAIVVTGQRDSFMGMPVVVSGKLGQNLDSTGVVSATAENNTKTGFLMVYRPGFSNADRQEAELDEDPTPKELLQTKVLVDARYDFQPNYKVSTEPIVVYGHNIDSNF